MSEHSRRYHVKPVRYRADLSRKAEIKNEVRHGPDRSLMLRMQYAMYYTAPGRMLLRAASNRRFSAVCGRFLDSSLSRPFVPVFIRRNHINRDDFYDSRFRSFNACFTRRIHEDLRPIDADPKALIAPCDGRLSAYRVHDGLVMPIKQSWYSVSDLLGGDPVAESYRDGLCLVFRLCVDDYHRYCYIDDGTKGSNVYLPGVLHTVRPIALSALPVFVQNCREYTVMDTDDFGPVIQIEVGALMVGKIRNHDGCAAFRRGDEKGMFLYGGSTIVVLIRKGQVVLDEAFFKATEAGLETPVRMGQAIGHAEKMQADA